MGNEPLYRGLLYFKKHMNEYESFPRRGERMRFSRTGERVMMFGWGDTGAGRKKKKE